jgi:hypothetical protein
VKKKYSGLMYSSNFRKLQAVIVAKIAVRVSKNTLKSGQITMEITIK